MPVKTLAGGRKATLILFLRAYRRRTCELGLTDAFAQSPFGAPKAPAPAPLAVPEGITGWLLAKQAEFYRMLSGTIRAGQDRRQRRMAADGYLVRSTASSMPPVPATARR